MSPPKVLVFFVFLLALLGNYSWRLGSGPKVKSQATVLWRQTRGLRVPLWGEELGAACSAQGAGGIGRRLTQKRRPQILSAVSVLSVCSTDY